MNNLYPQDQLSDLSETPRVISRDYNYRDNNNDRALFLLPVAGTLDRRAGTPVKKRYDIAEKSADSRIFQRARARGMSRCISGIGARRASSWGES